MLLFIWLLCQLLSMANGLDATFASRLCIILSLVYLIQRKFACPNLFCWYCPIWAYRSIKGYGFMVTTPTKLNSNYQFLMLTYSFYDSISVPYFQVETTKVFLRDTSVISPYSLLLFGGSMVIQHQVLWLSSNTRPYWNPIILVLSLCEALELTGSYFSDSFGKVLSMRVFRW